MNLLLLEESSYLSISKSFSSTNKRNHLSSRLNASRESLSLKVNFFEITTLFQRLGPQYEMQYWLKFFRHGGFWIEFSFRRTNLVFVLWVKILGNKGGFRFCLHLYIKNRVFKIINLKTFKAFIRFDRGRACTYRSLWQITRKVCFWQNKDVQVYFCRCLPRQYLHSLHNYE